MHWTDGWRASPAIRPTLAASSTAWPTSSALASPPRFWRLQLFHEWQPNMPPISPRTIWAIGALYVGCAAIRLARFNVSNEHGEQHHFSFLGLPSPGAAAVIAGFVLMQQDLAEPVYKLGMQLHPALYDAATALVWLLPPLVLVHRPADGQHDPISASGQPLSPRPPIDRATGLLPSVLLLLVVVHRYTIGIGTLLYSLWGPIGWAMARLRRRALAKSE